MFMSAEAESVRHIHYTENTDFIKKVTKTTNKMTRSLVDQNDTGNDADLQFASNNCVNCCQELLCSTSCSSGKDASIGAGVVAFTSFVKNLETQILMKDALQAIYSGLNRVELENCALCVDCSLVFAQLFGLFHAFESRRKSDGLLDLILSNEGLEWNFELTESKRELSDADESHEETNEDDFQNKFESSANTSGGNNSEFPENESGADEYETADDLITVQVIPKAEQLVDHGSEWTNRIDDDANNIEETATVPQQSPIIVKSAPETASTSQNSEIREDVTSENNKLFKCIDCGERFSTETGLGRHRINLHGAKASPYVCHICLYNCKRLGDLKVHILRHISTEEHKCSECGKNFKIFKSLQVHMRTQHGINLRRSNYVPCQTGKMDESQKKNLNEDLPEAPGQVAPPTGGTLQCTQCPLAFDTQIELAAHLTCQHKKCKCEICGKLFLARCKLRDHERYAHGKVRCIYCKKSVKRCSMAGHLAATHPDKKPKSLIKAKPRRPTRKLKRKAKTSTNAEYCCSDCPQIFDNFRNFRMHRMTHTMSVEDIFKCHICHKTFSEDSRSLRHHVQRHNVSTDWRCAHCSMRFVMRTQRNEHEAQTHGVQLGNDSDKDTTSTAE